MLLSRVRRRCALKDWAERLAARAGRKKAKVAMARKLAVLLARLWQGDETFDWRVGVNATAGAGNADRPTKAPGEKALDRD